jgi:hypothetical protein
MIAVEQRNTEISRVQAMRAMRIALLLALTAALSYVMIGLNILPVGDLQTSEAPAAITYVCAGSYLVGGLLVLLRRRWLWVVGAVINAMVMLVFFAAYMGRPSVMFSPGGLVTKATQLLLEAGLMYIIITGFRRSPRQAAQAAQAA